MQRSLPYSILGRFVLGAAGALGAGYLVFDPSQSPFQCITLGALVAGALALVRTSRATQALVLCAAYVLLRLGLVDSVGWGVGVAGVILGAGVFLIALIYQLLHESGLIFGKFLIVGPLLGGIFLVAAPFAEFQSLTQYNALRTLLLEGFVGMVIGEGAGFGVELVDLAGLSLSRTSAQRGAPPPETR